LLVFDSIRRDNARAKKCEMELRQLKQQQHKPIMIAHVKKDSIADKQKASLQKPTFTPKNHPSVNITMEHKIPVQQQITKMPPVSNKRLSHNKSGQLPPPCSAAAA